MGTLYSLCSFSVNLNLLYKIKSIKNVTNFIKNKWGVRGRLPGLREKGWDGHEKPVGKGLLAC